MESMSSAYDRIYAVIKRIPRGRVATYGQIARLAGLGGQARQVGYALSALPEGNDVPWQRVINAKGRSASDRSRTSRTSSAHGWKRKELFLVRMIEFRCFASVEGKVFANATSFLGT